ncbi:MAG: hypothetical protein ABIU05_19950 [Nitrospirales bacterium]
MLGRAAPVTDLNWARQFYEATLGLTEARFFGNENQGFVEYDIGAGTRAIGIGTPEWKPSRGVVVPPSKWTISMVR